MTPPPKEPMNCECLSVGLCAHVYRQVVAAVAADKRGFVVAISLVSISLQSSGTHLLKCLQ